jgi:hypothetical protein
MTSRFVCPLDNLDLLTSLFSKTTRKLRGKESCLGLEAFVVFGHLKTTNNLFRYYLHLSEVTRQNMRSEIDDFGDSYCDDLDTADLVQVCHVGLSGLRSSTHPSF